MELGKVYVQLIQDGQPLLGLFSLQSDMKAAHLASKIDMLLQVCLSGNLVDNNHC